MADPADTFSAERNRDRLRGALAELEAAAEKVRETLGLSGARLFENEESLGGVGVGMAAVDLLGYARLTRKYAAELQQASDH